MPTPTLRILLAVMLVSVAFTAVACTTAEPPAMNPVEPPATESPAQVPSEPDDDDHAGPAFGITAQQAGELALDLVSGGAVVEIEPSREAGRNTWEVIVRQPDAAGIEIYIDAETGDVIKQEPEEVPSEAAASPPTFTAAQAMDAALAAVPGMVSEVELGTERGRVVWEIIITGDSGRIEVYVDATSGEIVKQEPAD